MSGSWYRIDMEDLKPLSPFDLNPKRTIYYYADTELTVEAIELYKEQEITNLRARIERIWAGPSYAHLTARGKLEAVTRTEAWIDELEGLPYGELGMPAPLGRLQKVHYIQTGVSVPILPSPGTH